MVACIISAWWPIALFCCSVLVCGALVNMLLVQGDLSAALYNPSVANSMNIASLAPPSWHGPGPGIDSTNLLEALQGTLETMQSKIFWNGTYWPATIQWIGAAMNTFVVSAEQSLVDVLEDMGGHALTLASHESKLQEDVQQYWNGIEAYYGEEDASQIFGAAYDDAQWVVLEWLQAIRFMQQNRVYANSSQRELISRFAHRAHVFYNIVQNQFNTSYCGGGLTWNPALAPYKNAITNELFLSSSIAMYLYFPGDNNTDPYPNREYKKHANTTLPLLKPLAAYDPTFLENAKKEWVWFMSHNFTNAQGLVIDGFHISKNQTTCDERNEMVYTYNQGVLLSGLRDLWEATGDDSYLSAGYEFINTTIGATGWFSSSASRGAKWAGLGRNGIMEDYCDAPAKCSQDAQIFKGIYFQHLNQFCEPLPTSAPLVPNVTYVAPVLLASHHEQKCQSYIPWIRHNALAALRTRNSSNVIGGWWGASDLGKSQWPSLPSAQPLPFGSLDVVNEPAVLQTVSWACESGDHGCASAGKGYAATYGRCGECSDSIHDLKRASRGRRRSKDPNDRGRGRTIETQASGVAVVKAAFDFLHRLKRASGET